MHAWVFFCTDKWPKKMHWIIWFVWTPYLLRISFRRGLGDSCWTEWIILDFLKVRIFYRFNHRPFNVCLHQTNIVSSFVFCDYKDEPGRSDQQIFIPTANVRVQSSTPESNPEIKKSATQVMLSGAVTLEWSNCRMEADDYGKLLYLSGHIYIFRKLYDWGKCYLLWRLSQNCERVHVYITVKKRHSPVVEFYMQQLNTGRSWMVKQNVIL